MTQTIEQLQARVAELEADNARLKEIEQTNDTMLNRLGDKNAALLDEVASQKHCYAEAVANYEKQLILAQADNKRLRDALIWLLDSATGCDLQHIQKTLAQPSDTSALDAYVAEKVKESMK